MKRAPLLLLFASSLSYGANFATCILDRMPGVQNDAAAIAINHLCRSKFPEGMAGVPRGSGRGLFSFDSGAECAAKKAAQTLSRPAGSVILSACIALYDKPNQFDEFK